MASKHNGSKVSHRAGFTIPLAVVAGFTPTVVDAANYAKYYGVRGVGFILARNFLGVNIDTGKWSGGDMIHGLTPVVLGLAAHKFIGGKLGINRMLAKSGIPLVRI